jgi:23S rRNA (uracil1939-C5)-methyltransferase
MIDAASADLPDGTTLSTEATTLHWRGHVFRATPDSFIQVNQAQMDILYGRVLRALGEIGADARRTARVVDAYAGIGVLSVAIADAGAEVVCIEENRASARMGMLNARVNGVDDRVSYVAEAVEDALPRVIAAGAVDAVILDPPRAGCDARVTAWLALAGPRRVVYISCDPATLARDLRILAASGPYEIEALDIVDMFPQTHHVECVASLRRTGG